MPVIVRVDVERYEQSVLLQHMLHSRVVLCVLGLMLQAALPQAQCLAASWVQELLLAGCQGPPGSRAEPSLCTPCHEVHKAVPGQGLPS